MLRRVWLQVAMKIKLMLLLSWIPKASRASVYRSWRGGTYTYPKWPRMQNICKTHVKHKFLRWWTYVMRMWSVCAAQVKTYVSRMWNICETYAKYMWHINVFWDWIALCLCFTYVYVCEFMCFLCRRKIRPYFVQITQNKALFWNARKENINKTQTRTQTHFVTFVYVHVYMVYVLFMSGEK